MLLITTFLIIKLVRDASAAIDLEKAFKQSASIEMIHKRYRQFSSMEGNETTTNKLKGEKEESLDFPTMT